MTALSFHGDILTLDITTIEARLLGILALIIIVFSREVFVDHTL